MSKQQPYKNSVCFILDASGSMSNLRDQVVKVFDRQVKYLSSKSKQVNQETRATVYTFSNTSENIVFDVDVLRTPDIDKLYHPGGSTALIDATIDAIQDLKKIPQIHGDFGFLLYVISDGFNNIHDHRSPELSNLIKGLDDNWTVAFLAPNATAKAEAKRFGFPEGNIQIWDVSEKGLEDVGDLLEKTADSYMLGRSKGVVGTKNLFTLDTKKLTKSVVKNKLQELTPDRYSLLPVGKDVDIKSFVESWKIPFVQGGNYFMLTKPEKVQPYKQLVIQDRMTGKMYGGKEARELLSLPDYEIRVSPTNFSNYNIFCQSSSINRKLIKGTQLLVMK